MGPTEVDEVSFREQAEYWNEYLVDDGTHIRVKMVATSIYRLVDRFDAEGNPQYLVASTNVMKVDAPEELRQRPDGEG
jgi:hypothetical protein